MSTTMDHRIETSSSVSLAVAASSVEGADVKSMPVSPNGLSSELLEELAALAAEKVRGEGLRLMGDGGLLPELAQHLMQAALEAEMDEHLAAEAGRTSGRGSRSGGNMRNGYQAKEVMTEVGAVTVQVPRDRLGTFRPRMLPAHPHRRAGRPGDPADRKGPDLRRDRLPPRPDLRDDDHEGAHLHDHRQGPTAERRWGAGAGLSPGTPDLPSHSPCWSNAGRTPMQRWTTAGGCVGKGVGN
ncbi:transposase [Streptomyces sp. NPDC001843]|uniref:transposase n=1 Tax=Streptomyces sp. NPDC001843 TaxID=3364617 RepID=UPI00367D252D